MKKLSLLVLVTGLFLNGCLGSPEPIDQTIDNQNKNNDDFDYDNHYSNDGPGYRCDPYLYKVKVKDMTYFVSLPSLCNTKPYIFKGDPGPDMGEKYEDLDPILQEEVIRAVMITHDIKN